MVEPSVSVWLLWVQPGRTFTTSLSPTCIRTTPSLVCNFSKLFDICPAFAARSVSILIFKKKHFTISNAVYCSLNTRSSDITGEAAGLALGLVMLGSKSAQAIEDMVGYAQETQHEKILRGLAVGIALVMYGRMEEADALIESLCRDKVRLAVVSYGSF